MPTKTKVFTAAMRKDIHAVGAELGSTAIQGMKGARDGSMPSRRAKGDGAQPQVKTEERLRLSHRVWLMLADENPRVASACTIGANPVLGEDTPLTAMRANRVAEVVATVEATTTDTFAGVIIGEDVTRVDDTGFALRPATGERAWRVAEDRNMRWIAAYGPGRVPAAVPGQRDANDQGR